MLPNNVDARLHISGRIGLWNDGSTSTHISVHTAPAIATRFNSTKRGWWWVYPPTRRWAGEMARDIDWGPAGFTGRIMDWNPLLAHLFGFQATDSLFPTGRTMNAIFLSRNPVIAAEAAAHLRPGPH